MSKTIEDLTNLEIVEDLHYWMLQTQMKSPPFVDEMFEILLGYIFELEKRFRK